MKRQLRFVVLRLLCNTYSLLEPHDLGWMEWF